MAYIQGTAGNDTKSGTNFSDDMVGLNGNDSLVGNAGTDVISGNSGNDTLAGGLGNDVLLGGAGDDVYLVGQDEGFDAISDGQGLDVLVMTGGPYFDLFATVRDGTDLLVGLYDEHNYTLDPNNAVRIINQYAGGGIDYIEVDLGQSNPNYGTDPALTRMYLAGGPVAGVINGINQGGFAELLCGGDGNDSIVGGGGYFDSVEGGAGDDTITISAGTQFSSVRAGDGNDVVLGGDGRDIFRAGRGFDVFDGGANAAGQGNGDRIDYRDADGGIRVDLAVTTAQYIGEFDGVDQLINIEDVFAGRFNDTVYGSAANNYLVGRDGRDILDGRAGVDTMDGGQDNDTYYVDNALDLVIELPNNLAFAGNDRVIAKVSYDMSVQALNVERLTLVGANLNGTGNGSNNWITGTAGANKLLGLSGNDLLVGGNGADTLEGGDHNDRLIGGFGIDSLAGGNGLDTFQYRNVSDSTSAARDIITDFTVDTVNVGAFVDRIDLRAIDAVAGNAAYDDAFTFIGTAAFSSVAAQLRAVQSGADTLVQADINADGVADLEILLANFIATNLQAIDFVL